MDLCHDELGLVQYSIELLRSQIDGVEETTDARGLREGQKNFSARL